MTSVSGQSFCYDANGNQTSGYHFAANQTRTISWTPFNMPATITQGGSTVSFEYGADRSRLRQVNSFTGMTKLYIDGIYEKEIAGGADTHIHYIQAGGQTIAIYKSYEDTFNDTLYLHRDHLGSVVEITDANASFIESFAYDAFGKRRQETDWDPASGTIFASNTPRGYTGHEHLDDVGLIHMNGRVYDPDLNRMLSADPFVQFPTYSQSYNRYSYVLNNPLTHTDSSGFCIDKGPACRPSGLVGSNAAGGGGSMPMIFAPQMGSQMIVSGGRFDYIPNLAVGSGRFTDSWGYEPQACPLNSGCPKPPSRPMGNSGINGAMGMWIYIEQQYYAGMAQLLYQANATAGEARTAINTERGTNTHGPLWENADGGGSGVLAQVGNPNAIGISQSNNWLANFFFPSAHADTVSITGAVEYTPDSYWTVFKETWNRRVDQIAGAADNAVDYWIERDNVVMGTLASTLTRDNIGRTATGLFAAAGVATAPGYLAKYFGPAKQWIRFGPSYSQALGQQIRLSLRWGSSPARNGRYIREIPNATLQRFNQWLRGLRLPGNSWRTQDPGHLHILP